MRKLNYVDFYIADEVTRYMLCRKRNHYRSLAII